MDADVRELRTMIDRLREIRRLNCDPKSNENRRYHALSSAISQINRAIADMESEPE